MPLKLRRSILQLSSRSRRLWTRRERTSNLISPPSSFPSLAPHPWHPSSSCSSLHRKLTVSLSRFSSIPRSSPHLRQPNQGAVFAQALAGASSNPSSNQKRTASMRDCSPSAGGEPLSKRRTSSGAALPTGPRSGGKNLLDRMGGAQGNESE